MTQRVDELLVRVSPNSFAQFPAHDDVKFSVAATGHNFSHRDVDHGLRRLPGNRGLYFFFRAFFAAFSLTRDFTILLINVYGIGSASGKRRFPFSPA